MMLKSMPGASCHGTDAYVYLPSMELIPQHNSLEFLALAQLRARSHDLSTPSNPGRTVSQDGHGERDGAHGYELLKYAGRPAILRDSVFFGPLHRIIKGHVRSVIYLVVSGQARNLDEGGILSHGRPYMVGPMRRSDVQDDWSAKLYAI